MEISISDIIKALLKKWLIMFAIVSITVAIGMAVGVSNYNKPQYSASSAYLFANIPPVTNISLYVGNARTILMQDYIKFTVSDTIADRFEGNRDYEVTIEISSAVLTIKSSAEQEDVAMAVVEEYGKQLLLFMDQEDLEIVEIIPPYPREHKPSLNSLIVQVGLFGFIGLFIGGVIVLTPLYNEKAKEERNRLQRLNSKEYDLVKFKDALNRIVINADDNQSEELLELLNSMAKSLENKS